MNSTVTLDASEECAKDYGMSFTTELPVSFEVTERYDESNDGWTNYPLVVKPGKSDTGISESDSACLIVLTDGQYTIKRALRQISPGDKEALTLKYAPILRWTDTVSWEEQGHPPGVWYKPDGTLRTGGVRSGSLGWLVDGSKRTASSRSVYAPHGHPESVYAGTVRSEWVKEKMPFCITASYSAVGKSGAESPPRCYNTQEEDPQPSPIDTPTPTPTPVPQTGNIYMDAWCNTVMNGTVWPHLVIQGQDYIFTLKYECSDTGYKVTWENAAGRVAYTWDDSRLPPAINGTLYAPPEGITLPPTSTPTPRPTSTPTPRPTSTPTNTPTPFPTSTPTSTPTRAPELEAPYVVFPSRDGLTPSQRQEIREMVATMHKQFTKDNPP